MNTLQRYVLKEILGPTGLGLLVFTFVFLVGQLFKLTELLLNSGIPASIAGELILLLLPSVMSLTIPMALLVGILLGVGRLAADREILAMRASGISMMHLAKPIIGFALLVSGLLIWANMKLVPYLNLKSSDLIVQISFRALSAIPAGFPFEIPTEGSEGKTQILIDSKDKNTGQMNGITLWTQMESGKKKMGAATQMADITTSDVKAALKDKAKRKKKKKKDSKQEISDAQKRTRKSAERKRKEEQEWDDLLNNEMQQVLILAKSGIFEPKIEDRVVYIKLTSGSIQLSDPHDKAAYDIINFDSLTKGIVPSFDKIEKGYFEKDPREMSTRELLDQIQIRDKRHKYTVELYHRFSVPLACIAFALFAFPLAVYVRPTGKSVAFAISFLLILFYYGLLEYGVAVGHSDSPFGPFAIFLPNVIIAAIGSFMLYRMVTK